MRQAYFRGPESLWDTEMPGRAMSVGVAELVLAFRAGTCPVPSGPGAFMPFSSCIQAHSQGKLPSPGNLQLVCDAGVVQQVSAHQTCSVPRIYWREDSEDFS